MQKFNKRKGSQKTLDIESIIKIAIENQKLTLGDLCSLLKNSMFQLELTDRLCQIQEIMAKPLNQNRGLNNNQIPRERSRTPRRKAPDIPGRRRSSQSRSKSRGESSRNRRLNKDQIIVNKNVFSAGNSRSQTPEPFSNSRNHTPNCLTPATVGSPTSPCLLDFDLPEGNHHLPVIRGDRFRSFTEKKQKQKHGVTILEKTTRVKT